MMRTAEHVTRLISNTALPPDNLLCMLKEEAVSLHQCFVTPPPLRIVDHLASASVFSDNACPMQGGCWGC